MSQANGADPVVDGDFHGANDSNKYVADLDDTIFLVNGGEHDAKNANLEANGMSHEANGIEHEGAEAGEVNGLNHQSNGVEHDATNAVHQLNGNDFDATATAHQSHTGYAIPDTDGSNGTNDDADQQQHIAFDPGLDDDLDSVLGDDDDAYSTSSLTSSVFNYIQEHGRTYNGYGERTYVLPNDEIELDRLDLQHHLLKMTFGDKLTLCEPERKKTIHNVLDLGTGTGIWPIEYGDAHPETVVLGVDVSPVMPIFVPANVKFEVMDIGQPWSFSFQFDFIFCRFMTGAIANWRMLIQECFHNLTPGGMVEVQDISFHLRCDDGSLPEDSAFRRWADFMLEASLILGCPLNSVDTIRELMIETGFEHVEKRAYAWPMNRWPKHPRLKRIGEWTFHDFTASLSGISLALFTRGLGWSPEALEVFLIDVRKDMKNTKYHAYWPIYSICASKPALAPPVEPDD